MSYKSEKLRKKVKPMTLVIIGAIVLAIVVFVIIMQPSKQQKLYYKFNNRDLPKDHVVEQISYKKLIKKLEKNEEFIVFFGSLENENTRLDVAVYDEEFKDENHGLQDNFKKIYFVEVNKLKDKQKENINETYELRLANEMAPTLIYFNNNEVVLDLNDYKINQESPMAQFVKNFYIAILSKIEAQ